MFAERISMSALVCEVNTANMKGCQIHRFSHAILSIFKSDVIYVQKHTTYF